MNLNQIISKLVSDNARTVTRCSPPPARRERPPCPPCPPDPGTTLIRWARGVLRHTAPQTRQPRPSWLPAAAAALAPLVPPTSLPLTQPGTKNRRREAKNGRTVAREGRDGPPVCM